MTNQKYTYRNQAQEIFNHIKTHPGDSIENIVSGTGWNRHLVETAVKLMVEQGIVKEVGQTDWQDFRYEAIERNTNPSRVDEITAEIKSFVGNINQDLQISTPSKVFDPSPFQKAASALSGFTADLVGPFSQQIANAIEQDRLIVDIAAIAEVAPIRVQDFYQSHSFSLDYIKAAVRAGAKLDEEDIKRTMEEKVSYSGSAGEWIPIPPNWDNVIHVTRTGRQVVAEQVHTFAVTLPNGDQRQVKAAYMEVDINSLYFKDEDNQIILAFGPGHWVWAERVEEDGLHPGT